VVPPRNLQDLFSDRVEPMYKMVQLLAEQNEKLRAFRDLLLPHLMRERLSWECVKEPGDGF
jgi:type I restriction enzyme, S subunit